ncbi:MAG TPA: ThuA domain-containing protein [Bryobacteraceae bacterium]|nr:ThuA domain-containing protein [Bryobacteraceae bacterium]
MKTSISVSLIVIASAAAGLSQTPPAGRGRAAAPPSESVRPGASHKVAGAVGGLLGWRVGAPSGAYGAATFVEAAIKTDAAGLGVIEASSSQKASPQISKNLDSSLSADELAAIKTKLRALSMRVGAYRVDKVDRAALDFAKSLGADMVITPGDAASLPAIDKLANDAGINVAVQTKDPKPLLAALGSLSSRLGIATDAAGFTKSGMKADRLMALELHPGATAPTKVLMEITKQLPPPEEQPDKCGNCGRPYGGTRPLFISIESGKAEDVAAFEKSARYAMGYRIEQDAKLIPITSVDKIPAAEKQAIEAGLPKEAIVKPKKARKLLVMDLNPAGGYYHTTVAHANFAIQQLAKNTGAFEPVFSNDPNNLKYPKIKQFDAVFLNSVVGEVFPDPDVLDGLLRFVREGGGVAGVHGTTYASMDLPEFSELMGAADGPHRVETATLKVDDPGSPLMKGFKEQIFPYTDEFYHFLPTGPFSREKLHVLLSIHTGMSDMSNWKVRPDNDYGLVWIKSYGKGRVFNCAMGHTPTLFATPSLAQMMLGGIQFVLGDLDADTTPSAKLAKK